MHRVIFYLFVLRFGTITTARKVTGDTTCTAEVNVTIHRCVAPVKSYAEILGSTINGISADGRMKPVTIPSINGVVMFQELCGKINAFDVCIKDARSRCPKHILINLIDVSYGYLCTEGYTDFMANANCLIDLDQDPLVKECHANAVKTIFTLYNNTKLDIDQRLFHLCSALSIFTFCIEKKVKAECGYLAWSIINKVLKDTTTTLIPTCTFVAPVKTEFITGKTQLEVVSNRSVLLNNSSREDRQKVQSNNSTTLSNGQFRKETQNGNVQGVTAPRTGCAAVNFSYKYIFHAIICFTFAKLCHYV